ncbi:MAG: hypothetical protein QHH13_07435 [Melioribacter sp.]|uniref:hypothetical protein n=1 Tax=Rosettibacter primus TaxID=3111523 RepID=UPI00247E938E|nr:hypothetical protein [Melioribacter sp.]
MKEKIIYGFAFTAAFIIVTLLMIYAASNYRNVFTFDFTPVSNIQATKSDVPPVNLSKNISKLRKELIDSLQAYKEKSAYDVLSMNVKDSVLIDSLRILLEELKRLKAEKEAKQVVPVNVQPDKNKEAIKKDSAYKVWIKNTVKLYEAMDSKKAAKIIQSYSDNIARDIIFSMKKKKAAEIIAELKPEVANRIISVQ